MESERRWERGVWWSLRDVANTAHETIALPMGSVAVPIDRCVKEFSGVSELSLPLLLHTRGRYLPAHLASHACVSARRLAWKCGSDGWFSRKKRSTCPDPQRNSPLFLSRRCAIVCE